MKKLILRLRSPSLNLDFTGQARRHPEMVNGWVLRETYRRADGRLHQHGQYHLVIERLLTTQDDAHEWHYEAIRLAERIDRIWPYAVGLPLGRGAYGPTLSIVVPPKGWKSNVDHVDRLIQTAIGGMTATISGGTVPWFRTDWWPGSRVAHAIREFPKLDDIELEMVELHYAANRSTSVQATTVLIAKALEIARELLPGRTDKDKEQALPTEISAELKQPLHEIYMRSNKHRETRHPVTKKPALSLHPKMGGQELVNYMKDADMIVRHIICSRLGLDTILLK